MDQVLIVFMALGVVAIPIVAIALFMNLQREVQRLRDRVARLEYMATRSGPPITAVPPQAPETTEPPPEPIPISRAASHTPEPEPLAPVTTTLFTPTQPAAGLDRSGIEQLVGGVWLQNVGAVLLLLGVFFLILWSYTTGRLGPGWLVLSGVLLGGAFVWRGDRLARAVPAFGHALVGVGFGIVYLSLYLGHFTLHALDPRVAFVALLATSLLAIGAGLHYRVQSVAVFGVIGAFVPQLLAAWVPMRGFALSPWSLLGYLALVDLAVFALAARAGWGALNLTALLLTTFTWVAMTRQEPHGWGMQIALSGLFTLLGLALLPRLASVRERVRPVELAVVIVTPLCLIGASAPFLFKLSEHAAAVLLLAHAVVYLLAALWAEPRRPDEDLWRPLSGAATLFFTAALALLWGQSWTPVAWCTEGSLLLWLGLGRKGWWLRVCGYLVATLGALMLAVALFSSGDWTIAMLPVAYPGGLRNLIALVVLAVTAARLAKARPHLSADEQMLSRGWTAGVNLLVMIWSAGEAGHAARAIEEPGGRWATAFAPGAMPADERVRTLAAVLTSGAWTVQAVALLAIGWQLGSAYARWLALGLLGLTVLKFLAVDLSQVDVFWRFLTAIVVGAALLGVSYLYQRRARVMARSEPGR